MSEPDRPLIQSQIYAEHARKALADAEAAGLPNVRRRFVIAARRWIALAQQARRMELRQQGHGRGDAGTGDASCDRRA